MTALKQFNRALEKLPTRLKELKKLITQQDWKKEEINQAISILESLEEGDWFDSIPYASIQFTRVALYFSPSECGVNNKFFNSKNILKACEYTRGLLEKINEISKYIQFTLDGWALEDEEMCIFYIRWEI